MLKYIRLLSLSVMFFSTPSLCSNKAEAQSQSKKSGINYKPWALGSSACVGAAIWWKFPAVQRSSRNSGVEYGGGESKVQSSEDIDQPIGQGRGLAPAAGTVAPFDAPLPGGGAMASFGKSKTAAGKPYALEGPIRPLNSEDQMKKLLEITGKSGAGATITSEQQVVQGDDREKVVGKVNFVEEFIKLKSRRVILASKIPDQATLEGYEKRYDENQLKDVIKSRKASTEEKKEARKRLNSIPLFKAWKEVAREAYLWLFNADGHIRFHDRESNNGQCTLDGDSIDAIQTSLDYAEKYSNATAAEFAKLTNSYGRLRDVANKKNELDRWVQAAKQRKVDVAEASLFLYGVECHMKKFQQSEQKRYIPGMLRNLQQAEEWVARYKSQNSS